MRKVVVLLAVIVLGLVAWWLLSRGQRPSPEVARADAAAPKAEAVAGPTPTPEPSARARSAPRKDLAQRNLMRQRILDAMHARERAAEHDAGSTGHEPDPQPASAPAPRPAEADDGEPAAGSLVDRTGNHGYLVKVMNEDLMPLADECYELALEEQPDLEGMLVMQLEIIGEEEIGGVVDSVQPASDNELSHPTLVECVRESILATTLPPPEQGGRDGIMLSLRLSPDNVE